MKYPPYQQGTVEVTHGHTLNYELYGNPTGIPVVFLHGGPGGGFDDKDKRFFDPKIWNVLLFDQRGAGKSTPFCEVTYNDTGKLVDDINALTEKFGFKEFVLFGGSWGSTLSLVYAMTHPARVMGMVLRGIYLNTPAEQEYIYTNARYFQPHVWERFMSHVPKKLWGNVNDVIKYYHSKIFSQDKKVSEKHCYEWSLYELSLLFLRPNIPKLEKMLETDPVANSLSKIEAHYFVNDCFLTKDFMKINIEKIQHIPTYIVHGSYDLVCPPSSAYWLHEHMHKSTLKMVHAGHASSDLAITKALLKGLGEMERLIK
ncbi:MAG: prolyl aminopeptidase [bacterium]|nr:prolyl aminopeptidase [bacterium]